MSEQEQKKTEVPTEAMVALIVFGLFGIIYTKRDLIYRLYFNHFETIWMVAFGVIAGLLCLATYHIVKRTRLMTDRGNLLAELSKEYGSINVGTTNDGVDLYLCEKAREGHSQFVGATGRGKTKSAIEPWACRDILGERSVLIIDGKGDPSIVDSIRLAAQKSLKEPEVHVFDLGNPKSSCATNPLEYGSAQQITDRIFTAFEFKDPYYRAIQYDTTGSIIELIQDLCEDVTFRRIYELLTDDVALSEAISKSENESLRLKLTRFLEMPRQARADKFSGIISQLGPFAVGEVAPLVNGATPEKRAYTVSQVVLPPSPVLGGRYQHIFVVLIPTLKYQQIGHQLGKLMLQELGWAVGERASRVGNKAPFTPVFLDEFSAFVYEGFANILNKARSSRVALHLSHQSLGDMAMVSPQFAQVVTTNTNIKCIFGLNDPESADFMARHMGTRTEEKLTEQASDRGLFRREEKTGAISIREVEAYKVHPNLLKNYVNGRGVLHLPTKLGNVTEEIQFAQCSEEELEGVA